MSSRAATESPEHGEEAAAACPCGHPATESERHPMPRSVFDVVRCRVCGNVYLYSGPEPVRRLHIPGARPVGGGLTLPAG